MNSVEKWKSLRQNIAKKEIEKEKKKEEPRKTRNIEIFRGTIENNKSLKPSISRTNVLSKYKINIAKMAEKTQVIPLFNMNSKPKSKIEQIFGKS